MNLKAVILQYRRQLSTNGVFYFFAQAIGALASFVSMPVLTRLYDPQIYGQYLLIVSTVAFSTVLFTHWLQQGVLRFLPGNLTADSLKRHLSLLSLFTSFLSALTGAVAVLSILQLNLDFALKLLVVAFASLVPLNAVQSSFHLAQENGRRFGVYLVLQGALPSILAIIWSYFVHTSLTALMFGQVIAGVLSLIVVWNHLPLGLPSRRLLSQFAAYGFPLTVWAASSQTLASLDRFLIARYVSVDAAGVYATNYNLVISIQSFLFGPLLLAAHPRLMKLWNSKAPDFPHSLKLYARLHLLLSSFSLSMFLSSSADIGVILMGPEFRIGNEWMPIISAGHAIWGYVAYLNKGFEFERSTWKMSLLALFAAVVNTALNLVFIPKFGVTIAAYTTLVAYVVYFMVTRKFSPRHSKLPLDLTDFLILSVPFLVYVLSLVLHTLVQLSVMYNLVLNGLLTLAALGFVLRKMGLTRYGGQEPKPA